jgi:hypothetical protein
MGNLITVAKQLAGKRLAPLQNPEDDSFRRVIHQRRDHEKVDF